MRKSRFSEEQKVKMLREAERSSVAAVAKKHGVSTETIYKWRRSFGGMEVADVKRLKQLAQENVRLKKLLAERDLEVEVMKEIAAKKWYACRHVANRWRTPGLGAFYVGAHAPCSAWRARRYTTNRSWR